MAQPRLAYAGVVELPQEVCQLPWTDEETLEQEDITCDDPPNQEEKDDPPNQEEKDDSHNQEEKDDPPNQEENGEEGLSVSDSIPIPNVSEVDANDMKRGNDGNARVEVKTMSRFNSGPDIAICFFHAESNDQEDMDPEKDKAWLDHGTELAEHVVGVDADVTSVKSLSTLPEQQGQSAQGNTLESTSIFCPCYWLCKKSIRASSASTHSSNIYTLSSFIKVDHVVSNSSKRVTKEL